MKKSFMSSLICHNGIVGGGIYINDNSITYKTNKLTVDSKYKNLVLPLKEISELKWKRIIFAIAILTMTDGEEYRFIIFNKRRFIKHYNKAKML